MQIFPTLIGGLKSLAHNNKHLDSCSIIPNLQEFINRDKKKVPERTVKVDLLNFKILPVHVLQ